GQWDRRSESDPDRRAMGRWLQGQRRLSLLKNLPDVGIESDVLETCGVQNVPPCGAVSRESRPAVRRPRLVGGARSCTRPALAIFRARSLLSARIAGARGCVTTTPRPGAGM